MSPIMAFDKKYQMRRLDGRTLDDLPWGNENAVAQLVEPKSRREDVAPKRRGTGEAVLDGRHP